MADTSLPQPDKISNCPPKGELKFLFRKKLTTSDVLKELLLTGHSSDYLRSLPRPLLEVVVRDGLMVWCYTPAIHHGRIVLKNNLDMTTFRFRKSGWDQVVAANQFHIGQEIDCWSLYDAEDGPHGNLSFLIQPVGAQVVSHEAASGATGTSCES